MKNQIIIKLFYTGLLFFIVSCGAGGSKNNSSNSSGDTAAAKGNSAGSNIMEMDTMNMDTSAHDADSVHH